MLDILLQFRIIRFNNKTGDELTSSKEIARNYLTSLNAVVDIMAIIPGGLLQIYYLDLLSIFKVKRLFTMSFNLNLSEMQKVVLKVVSLLLTLLLYIHITACLIYYVANQEQKWTPKASRSDGYDDFFERPYKSRYLAMVYTAMTILTGNDVEPIGDSLTALISSLTIIGSLITANIFGTFAVVVTALNRKS